MAATSASRNWAAFARRAVTTGAVAGLGLLALAFPASAHTPKVTPGCDHNEPAKSSVHVVLKDYQLNGEMPNNKTPNSVEVYEVVDGKDVVIKKEAFGKNLDEWFGQLDGTKPHTFKVIVKAWDDQSFNDHEGFSRTFDDLKTEICDKTPPSSESSTPSSPSSSTPAPPTTTTTEAAVVGANANLASTGASIAIPLAVGALLLVGGGVLLVLMRRRGRA